MAAPHIPHPVTRIAAGTLVLADHEASTPTRPEDLARVSAPLTKVLTLELDGAQLELGLATDEILLAALSRAIARAIGEGAVTVDVSVCGRSTVDPVPLRCTSARELTPTELLRDVRRSLAAVRQLGLADPVQHPAEVYFNDIGTPDGEPGPDHPLELRVYRVDGLLYLDWWYDVARFNRSTVEDLAAQFPLAMIELTSEAIPPIY